MKKTASINSSKFFLKNTSPYNSFIWLGKNFIDVAITNESCSKIEAVESYRKENGNINRSEALSIFQLPTIQEAANVIVGLESLKFTLVPKDLYQNKNTETYLSAVHLIDPLETTETQDIIPVECQSIFTLKEGTKALLEKEISALKILHAPSALLVAYQQMLPPNKDVYSFLRVNENDLTVTLFKNKKLQLHQSYEIDNTHDALYHYLNALEVLKFDRKKTPATILGRHSKLEEIKTALTDNLESVRFAKRLPTLEFTDEIFSQPAHRFFNLFALVLCA